jgi:pectate lyase-like protein
VSVTVGNFGARGDGSTDDTVAIQAAVRVCLKDNQTLLVPSGTYVCTAPITGTGRLHMFGAGVRNTIFQFPDNAGFRFTVSDQFHSVHLRDFSVLGGATGTGNAAIKLFNSANAIPNPGNTELSDISNVWVSGTDAPAAANYWSYGIDLHYVSNVNLSNVMVTGNALAQGTGLLVRGSEVLPPVVYNLSGCTFNYLNAGVEYGDYVQGVSITAGNFTGCMVGVDAVAGLTGLDQLSISASQFNCTVAAVNTATFIPDLTFSGNVVFIPGPKSGQAVGLNLIETHRGAVVGNCFSGFNELERAYGVVVYSNSGAGVAITGNSFSTLRAGVVLQATSKGNNVQSNVYSDVKNPVINTGSGNVIGGGSL